MHIMEILIATEFVATWFNIAKSLSLVCDLRVSLDGIQSILRLLLGR